MLFAVSAGPDFVSNVSEIGLWRVTSEGLGAWEVSTENSETMRMMKLQGLVVAS